MNNLQIAPMSINGTDFQYICQLVRDRAAVELGSDKKYLVESRLTALARKIEVGSVSELVAQLRLQQGKNLQQQVVEAMMTTETLFFRDKHPFEALKKSILPELIKQRESSRSLSIWSAACSSGQEPYSIAMLLRENFPQLITWKVQLLGSDISEEILARAREGRYNQQEISRGLPQTLLLKYFHYSDNKWQMDPEIRRMVEFSQLNLAKAWPPAMPQMDIIFLRNLLIYFSVETKQAILGRVRQLLRPDGYLFLGGGETTLNLDDGFKPVQLDKAVCYRIKK
ncbi:MAG: protein-glutamate O-methyltransferase CheR [Hormoscilla sp.]